MGSCVPPACRCSWGAIWGPSRHRGCVLGWQGSLPSLRWGTSRAACSTVASGRCGSPGATSSYTCMKHLLETRCQQARCQSLRSARTELRKRNNQTGGLLTLPWPREASLRWGSRRGCHEAEAVADACRPPPQWLARMIQQPGALGGEAQEELR